MGNIRGSLIDPSKLSARSIVSCSISESISSAISVSLASVYLIAAAESQSIDQKFPCQSTNGYLRDHGCAIRTIAS